MADATLTVLRGRLAAALVAVDQLIAAADRRCADCNRRSDDLAECADGRWRGPTCRKRWETSGDFQLPFGGEIRTVHSTAALTRAGVL